MPVKLSVNLNKVALLRNQRDVGYPSVLEAARMVVAAGAHGITVHPRPDERHIRRSDVLELAELIAAELGPGGRVQHRGLSERRLHRADPHGAADPGDAGAGCARAEDVGPRLGPCAGCRPPG